MLNLIFTLITLYSIISTPIKAGDTNNVFSDAERQGLSVWYDFHYVGGWGKPVFIFDVNFLRESKYIPALDVILLNEFNEPLIEHELQHAIDFHRNPFWTLTHVQQEEFRAYTRQFSNGNFVTYKLTPNQLAWVSEIVRVSP